MIDDISRKRWETISDASAHTPRQALLNAVADFDARGWPDHVIIVYGKRETDGTIRGYKQAGTFDDMAQAGLLSIVHSDLVR